MNIFAQTYPVFLLYINQILNLFIFLSIQVKFSLKGDIIDLL